MEFPTTLYSRLVIAYNGLEGPDYFQAGEANIYPGTIVMFDDADEVAVCTANDHPIGIAGCEADQDFSTAFTAGQRIPVWMLGCGVELYVRSSNSATVDIEIGSKMQQDDRDNGCASLAEGYTDSAERTDSINFYIGRASAAGELTADTTMYIPIRLSL